MPGKDPTNGITNTNGTTDFAPEGSLASFKNFYQGPLDKNKQWSWTEKEPQDVADPAENEETAQHALITRLQKSDDSRRKYKIHSIIIQSQWLKTALVEILKDYPAIHCGLKRLEFQAPFNPFVHRWSQLLEYKNRKDLDDTTAEHVELLYKVLSSELKDVIKTFEDYISHGIVTFDHVWIMYQPGALIYSNSHNGAYGVYKLKSGSYVNSPCGMMYQLNVEAIDWNGSSFGRTSQTIRISDFHGAAPILGLAAFPLSFHPHEAKVREALISRGKKFEALAGSHYMRYDGFAIGWDKQGNEIPYMCTGRIIIDSDSFKRFSPRSINRIDPLTVKECAKDPEGVSKELEIQDPTEMKYVFRKQDKEERLRLTEDHHLLCLPRVRGYSLKKKQWLFFYLDLIQDIEFNDNAFASLVLPEDQKELILSFAESQAMGNCNFDDIISGKGRGHITLLSGPPGVGKTLTAESVAEHMRAPLFMMSAGDLGIDPDEVETKLTNILEMISKWNAVLLLDECDVFLEARSTHDLERNKLVSIFLRVLEYYEGMLFLTTNRIDNIDAAFQSRIHISIAYPNLTSTSRKSIWQNFLGSLGGLEQWKDLDLEEMASVELNGRQIKNVLKSASLLAVRKKEALNRKYVDMVLGIEKRRPGVAAGF